MADHRPQLDFTMSLFADGNYEPSFMGPFPK